MYVCVYVCIYLCFVIFNRSQKPLLYCTVHRINLCMWYEYNYYYAVCMYVWIGDGAAVAVDRPPQLFVAVVQVFDYR